MWYDIPEKQKQDLKQDNTVRKGRDREDDRMGTILYLVPDIELIEYRKYESRKKKREYRDEKSVEKV